MLALSLSIAPSASASTVLCKTASSPCTGGTYGKGTTVEASLKSGTKSLLEASFGNVECSESTIKGEVTNPGGEGAAVSGTVTSLSLSTCNSGNTVKVLKPGSFRIEEPKEGNGTLKLEGFETEVIHLGVQCNFSGPASFTLKGGEMASTSGSATVPRTGGSGGAFCAESAHWKVEYTITAPAPLFVEEP
ncbi:MAG: hypothetical protein ACTHN7_12220 [Solirubrobacterales bacterium]